MESLLEEQLQWFFMFRILVYSSLCLQHMKGPARQPLSALMLSLKSKSVTSGEEKLMCKS